eukprot:CAMPEP_0201622206 /NCGR_PEP_ID=MMETSP0492-20130828/47288_1 /ASSEMBLY_ACC=CAM_ASM_000837 /TAXON_ID=420259 /ORGANISM="Thalassiosira gravida, Strain GMp14c1" /LENGTH=169 /DNA_ID=CAMNT_0048091789 /DNA_START=9 /DNA_END=518 /DNA_ORIENTATION=+
MMALGKLAASGRPAQLIAQSIASKSHIGSLSLFSSASSLATASKKPSQRPSDQFGRFILPTTILPSSSSPAVAENPVWRTALLQQLQKKKKEEVNSLQCMLDSLRIARLPTNKPPTTTVVVPEQQQQHTFQVMNRNARKPKRANHGKRPCSRIRRRYKFKKWANTSRRG